MEKYTVRHILWDIQIWGFHSSENLDWGSSGFVDGLEEHATSIFRVEVRID
jgi:hypothetical protein